MATLVDEVRVRLEKEDCKINNVSTRIERAIKLSDRYSAVQPEEYVLPLTLSIGLNRTRGISNF